MSDVDKIRELNQLLEEKVIERTLLLTRAKRTWQATFDAFVDPLSIVDHDMCIVRTNLAFARHCGADVRDINGKKCHQVLFGQNSACTGCPVSQTFASGKAKESEIADEAGGRVFRMWSVPLHADDNDESSGHSQVVCHYKDVTDEKELTRRVIQTEKMAAVGTLAGGVAHEINNPLGAILAFTQLAMTEAEEGSSLRDFLQEIESSAERCKHIVASLLGFSRQSHGERKPVVLGEVADRAIFLCRSETMRRNVEVITDYNNKTPKILADGNQIQQVLINLISNASHAIDNNGAITIRTSFVPGKSVSIKVSDNGPGIALEHQEKLFEPFFTTKPEDQGTGLGLSVSYGIVEDHGGKIEVTSKKGKGAAFELIFPWPREESDSFHE
jgi:two-component system NtrC family sensor kinase